MKNNTREALFKIGEFLGQEFVVKLKANNEMLLNKVLEISTVEKMKGSLGPIYKFALRKGIVGDWKNHFTKEGSDLVVEKVRKFFTGTGLQNLWMKELEW
jgi:hypothetical protein